MLVALFPNAHLETNDGCEGTQVQDPARGHSGERRAMRRAIMGAGLLLGLAGCAGMRPVPTEQLVKSEVAIRQAEEAGAEHVPEAAQLLTWAREQTSDARKMLEQDEREQAALLLQRAEADAELALSLAREAPARAEAKRALEEVQQLQQGGSGQQQ
jgi:Domain of unknown function (DUF4398)